MSAGSAALRRGGAASAALVAAVALIAVSTAVALGTRIASERSLPALTRAGDPGNYARNAIGRLTPVDAKFVARRVGRVPGTHTTTTTASPSRPHQPSTAPPPDRSIRGKPGSFPGLAPGGWVLTLRMVPSENTARSGDEIRYRMIVKNTGTQDFRGRSFELDWHTPNGTVGRNAVEQCNVVATAIVRAICLTQRVMISPGLGDASHQRFDSAGLVAIGPGQEWVHDWFVQVLPSNTAGATIFNHAHLKVNINGLDHWIRTPDVVVTVVA